jgi:DNA-binding protein YbaB
MANEQAMESVNNLLSTLREQVAKVAEVQREWAQMTATGSAAGKRVTVVVNAEGVVIETRFTADADQLDLTELAKAVTAAAQEAAATAKRTTADMMAPLLGDTAIPKVSDFFPEIPDIGKDFPRPPQVSTAPPDSPERVGADRRAGDTSVASAGFSDVFDG